MKLKNPFRGTDADVSPDRGGAAAPVDAETLKSQVRASRRAQSGREKERLDASVEAELDELFERENWEEIATLYFDARFVTTGFEPFRLSEKKRKVLGLTLSKAMRLLVRLDPGYLALAIFGIQFGSTLAQTEALFAQEKKKLRLAARAAGTATVTPIKG